MQKDTKTYLYIVIIVALIIGGIYAYKHYNQQTPEEKEMKCISDRALLYSQTTCVHCKTQRDILGKYVSLFDITECDQNPALCTQITGTPTWEIDGKLYPGVQTVDKLKELTGC